MALVSLDALQKLTIPEAQLDLPELPADQIKHLMALTAKMVNQLPLIGRAIDLVDDVMAELATVRSGLKRKAEELPDQIANSQARVAQLVGDLDWASQDPWVVVLQHIGGRRICMVSLSCKKLYKVVVAGQGTLWEWRPSGFAQFVEKRWNLLDQEVPADSILTRRMTFENQIAYNQKREARFMAILESRFFNPKFAKPIVAELKAVRQTTMDLLGRYSLKGAAIHGLCNCIYCLSLKHHRQ